MPGNTSEPECRLLFKPGLYVSATDFFIEGLKIPELE